MDDTVIITRPPASVEEIQKDWNDLKLRVQQLDEECLALEKDNRMLRALVERVIEHRGKSHGELILLLSGLVSKLPINDIGVVISKLVEHNANVSETCAVLVKGKADAPLPQPALLKALDQTKRDLKAAIKPTVEELLTTNPPLDHEMLRSLEEKPDLFFTPPVVRANRCFVKGQLPRERVVKEFGDVALAFFNDLTTDPKLNPRPKAEEIVLAFKSEFEALVQQNAGVLGDKTAALQTLYQRVQQSKAVTDQSRLQKKIFFKLSFELELLHYYENQSTEAPDVVFAGRLPALVEQFVFSGGSDQVEEKMVTQAEALLAHIVNADHRMMVINNIGKAGGNAKTLKLLLRLRAEKNAGQNPTVLNEIIPDFIKHLMPAQKAPPTPVMVALLKMFEPDLQKMVVKSIMGTDRLKKEEAEKLGKELGKELNIAGLEMDLKQSATASAENERMIAWEKVRQLISGRSDPGLIATAIRDRLHAKYDADEVKQSWVTLTDADPITLIRVFCQLPYLPNGSTDPVARAVMETYVTRLTHEKYASIYQKVVKSLKSMFNAKPDSPTLLNFVALVRWVDVPASAKLTADIGMPA